MENKHRKNYSKAFSFQASHCIEKTFSISKGQEKMNSAVNGIGRSQPAYIERTGPECKLYWRCWAESFSQRIVRVYVISNKPYSVSRHQICREAVSQGHGWLIVWSLGEERARGLYVMLWCITFSRVLIWGQYFCSVMLVALDLSLVEVISWRKHGDNSEELSIDYSCLRLKTSRKRDTGLSHVGHILELALPWSRC